MLGGAALGSAIGYIGSKVINKWQADDHVNFTLSIALAIGGYVIGDHVLHVSGVVTTVFTRFAIVNETWRYHYKSWSAISYVLGLPWIYYK